MIMQKQPNWAEWFINNPNNEAGNNNLQAFSDVLGSEVSTEAKIRDLVDKIDTVILIADANRNTMLLHSPKKIGDTRSRPDNKVSWMIGLGARATSIFPVLNSTLEDICVVVPSVQELSGCKSAQDVENVLALDQNGEKGFKGLAIFIPGPVLRNAILESNWRNPSELIPIIYQTAWTFDQDII